MDERTSGGGDYNSATLLTEIIAEFGMDILFQQERCRALLNDLTQNHRPREVYALMCAVRAKVAAQLVFLSGAHVDELRMRSLVKRIVNQEGLSPEIANWALQQWAAALDVYLPKNDAKDAVLFAADESERIDNLLRGAATKALDYLPQSDFRGSEFEALRRYYSVSQEAAVRLFEQARSLSEQSKRKRPKPTPEPPLAQKKSRKSDLHHMEGKKTLRRTVSTRLDLLLISSPPTLAFVVSLATILTIIFLRLAGF